MEEGAPWLLQVTPLSSPLLSSPLLSSPLLSSLHPFYSPLLFFYFLSCPVRPLLSHSLVLSCPVLFTLFIYFPLVFPSFLSFFVLSSPYFFSFLLSTCSRKSEQKYFVTYFQAFQPIIRIQILIKTCIGQCLNSMMYLLLISLFLPSYTSIYLTFIFIAFFCY